MKVVFRTDSSIQIGSGHVMRCLTLADELRRHGADVMFVCREHPGNLIGIIEGKGYQVVRLQPPEDGYAPAPEDVAHAGWLGVSWRQDAVDTIKCLGEERPHWLVVDNYALARPWEEVLRSHVGKIMVIDDLADRPHDCDLLLDQNLYEDMATRYDTLVPGNCIKLIGPRNALLRPEFLSARKNLRQREGQVRRVLVFFGGVDPTNETEKALQALASISDRSFDVDVVVGNGNPHKERIQNICDLYDSFHYHCQIDNMAELMAMADLAIGAGGTATWERCALGLPTVVITLSANQEPIAGTVASYGAVTCLGNCDDITVEQLRSALFEMLDNQLQIREMSRKAMVLLDGSGVVTVCSKMLAMDLAI